jgi:hypothetical protein
MPQTEEEEEEEKEEEKKKKKKKDYSLSSLRIKKSKFPG